jgi:hypothetical protein
MSPANKALPKLRSRSEFDEAIGIESTLKTQLKPLAPADLL